MSKEIPLLDLLRHYESIELTLKSLEEERTKIGQRVIEEFHRQGATKSPKLEYGIITLLKRKSWKFSSKVKQIEDLVKNTKEAEKKSGKASYSVTDYLVYKPEKKAKK